MYLFRQGESLKMALHSGTEDEDQDYQRHTRIFSLQLRKLPIKMKMKDVFTLNYALLMKVIWKIKCSNI